MRRRDHEADERTIAGDGDDAALDGLLRELASFAAEPDVDLVHRHVSAAAREARIHADAPDRRRPAAAPVPVWQRRRVRVVALVAVLASTFTAAGAVGALPARVQHLVAELAAPLGLDLPDPEDEDGEEDPEVPRPSGSRPGSDEAPGAGRRPSGAPAPATVSTGPPADTPAGGPGSIPAPPAPPPPPPPSGPPPGTPTGPPGEVPGPPVDRPGG